MRMAVLKIKKKPDYLLTSLKPKSNIFKLIQGDIRVTRHDLNKKLQDARLEQEKTVLSRQIVATDGAIDKLVYELYGLTDEEVKIVESGNEK